MFKCTNAHRSRVGEITMIISASRRTDIPSYYSDWFFNRIKDEHVYVRNPMNIHQVGKISLSPDVVDGIVFWTKNPAPMLDRLSELEKYTYYFQFTLNSYGNDVEPNIPPKKDVIIPAFQRLSTEIGKDKVVWRYDPIIFNEKYNMQYHIKYFESLVDKLANYTEKCTVSFVDFYEKTKRNISPLGITIPTASQKIELIGAFSEIAKKHGIYIDTCAEDINLQRFGISHASCIDKNRFERIGKYKLNIEKDKNQRLECGCISSIDIGAYNTCKNGCLYCYANFNTKIVSNNFLLHNPNSPLLFGEIGEDDVIKVREMKSYKINQLSLFE